MLEARDEKRRLHLEFATRFATRNFAAINSVRKSGGREGFIPLPEVHEIKRLSNIPEYSYLGKYLARKRQLDRSNDYFFSTRIDGVLEITQRPTCGCRSHIARNPSCCEIPLYPAFTFPWQADAN